MPEKKRLEDYELFYMEIPNTESDPLSEVSNDIQDDHDQISDYEGTQGLSADQVTQIAQDSLANAERELPMANLPSDYNLFSPQAHEDPQ